MNNSTYFYCIRGLDDLLTEDKIYDCSDNYIYFDNKQKASIISHCNLINIYLLPITKRTIETGDWVLLSTKLSNFNDISNIIKSKNYIIKYLSKKQTIPTQNYFVIEGFLPGIECRALCCIENVEGLQKGKTYYFTDGKFTDDNGNIRPSYKIRSYEDPWFDRHFIKIIK